MDDASSADFLDAELAFETSNANSGSRWPTTAAADNRLFPNCRPQLKPKFIVDPNARVFAIGSCFARNIEEYLARVGMDVISTQIEFPAAEMSHGARHNDLLVKYTPPSILQELRFALDETCTFEDQLKFLAPLRSGLSVDLTLPSWYSAVKPGRAIERRRQITALFSKIRSADLVIMTLGLIETWYDRQADGFICEVPSRDLLIEYPRRFAFFRLDYEQARAYTSECIELIRKVNPAVKIVLTTSPVPLGRTFSGDDIIVANGYSKAVLRSVAGSLTLTDPSLDYYPSFEMVMLSDPRDSWASDQRHVTDSRVGDVVRSFISSYVPDASGDIRAQYVDAKILASRNDFRSALEKMIPLESFFPGDRQFLNDLCLAAEGAREDGLALEVHEKLDQVGETSVVRQMRRAQCYTRLGRHAEALDIANSIGPGHIGARLTKIDSLIQLKRTKDAREFADETLEQIRNGGDRVPRNGWVYDWLENCYRLLGASREMDAVRALRAINIGLVGLNSTVSVAGC